jgi:clan AA aspartic protease
MIVGVFRDSHPRIELVVSGTAQAQTLEFLVDTGFDGDLTLSSGISHELDLAFIAPRFRRLANGEERRFDIHLGSVAWLEGDDRDVEVVIMDGEPLFGTGLLDGMLLQVEGSQNGEVLIQPLD